MTARSQTKSSQTFQHEICGELQNVMVSELHNNGSGRAYEVSNQHYRKERVFVVTLIFEGETTLPFSSVLEHFIAAGYPLAIAQHFERYSTMFKFKEELPIQKADWLR